MRNIHFRLVSIAIIFGFSIIACKKDKNNGPNNKALVTSAPWYFSSAMIDQNNDGTGDLSVPPSLLLPCYTDNFLVFKADGTGTLDEGATTCNAGDPQTSPFTWSFTSGEQNINFSATIFPGATGDFKIITLDANQLILSRQVTIPGSPDPVTVIISFIH